MTEIGNLSSSPLIKSTNFHFSENMWRDEDAKQKDCKIWEVGGYVSE